jgi:hypothetical protein
MLTFNSSPSSPPQNFEAHVSQYDPKCRWTPYSGLCNQQVESTLLGRTYALRSSSSMTTRACKLPRRVPRPTDRPSSNLSSTTAIAADDAQGGYHGVCRLVPARRVFWLLEPGVVVLHWCYQHQRRLFGGCEAFGWQAAIACCVRVKKHRD